MDKNIKLIRKQFLSTTPIHEISWKNIFDEFSLNKQEYLINETVNSELVMRFPLPVNYQKTFVKHLLSTLEKEGSEIDDSLYEAYGRLVALDVDSFCFKHYLLDNDEIISLKENINLISNGTTGLRTWQAALALCEWSIKNQHKFQNETILELGCGIGLTGLVITLKCAPKHFHFTDCHPAVLETLCENVKLNINMRKDTKSCKLSKELDKCIFEENINTTELSILKLPWEEVTEEFCTRVGPINKIVAADIIYDSDLFPPLLDTLDFFAEFCKVEEFIFSCTERNKNTLDSFLELIAERNYNVENLDVPKQEVFIWSTETPVKMFSFSKRKT